MGMNYGYDPTRTRSPASHGTPERILAVVEKP